MKVYACTACDEEFESPLPPEEVECPSCYASPTFIEQVEDSDDVIPNDDPECEE